MTRSPPAPTCLAPSPAALALRVTAENGAAGCIDIDECAEGSDACSELVSCSNTSGGYSCGDCPAGYRGDGRSCTDVDECEEGLDGCDALASCTNTVGSYECGDCPAGYAGGGSTGCSDINECEGPDRACDALTECTNTSGSFSCGPCPAGYAGDGSTGCVDVDECAAGLHDCSPLVTCANTAGGYQCGSCPQGYRGDGRSCSDVDECAEHSAQCSTLVSCTNTSGGYECGACPAGYAGDGQTCADIDECASDPCDARTVCTNTAGAYTCSACPAGYAGDGYAGCVDVDECAQGTDTCSPLVTCANTDGSYQCAPCPAGYEGDGHRCDDVDECGRNLDDCSALSTCTNTVGSYTCGACPQGYEGNGRTCTDVNECASEPCDARTSCTNTDGSYVCGPCPSGYTGDGYAGCLDIDECAVENGGCPDTDACTNTPGSRECVSCAAGQVGMTTSCGTGACAARGVTSCVRGQVVDSCTPGQPTGDDTLCDGVDEDCDGQSDEGFASSSTSCGVGACAATGVTSCVNAQVLNSCAPGTPSPDDTSCDAIDSNCNGPVDEDFVPTSTSCGVGACARTGVTSCIAGQVTDSCTEGLGSALDATCDGIDDDCDGLIDEDYLETSTACGIGACGATGLLVCSNGIEVNTCATLPPAASDDCGQGDEDCDGYLDEDCCQPTTCNGLRANCGDASDGCGGTLHCGDCALPETCGGAGVANVCGVPNLPPDPEDVAPPLDSDVPPTTYEALSFLFTGANAVQQGVEPGAIKAHRIATIRGRIIDRDGNPLAGARVSVHNEPSLGFTLSRTDGYFDIAFNGGSMVTLDVSRPGNLPVQRAALVDWEQQTAVNDIAMVRASTVGTTISAAATTTQVVIAERVEDVDGARQPVLMFPPGFAPTVQVNGQSIPLSQLTVRVTEYTVGERGLAAMPANLPDSTAYTYAAEFSIDEVGPRASVQFAKDVPVYLDNFLGMPAGVVVPHGYYDTEQAMWVTEPDGYVLEVVAIENGLALLNIDQDPQPESDADLALIGLAPWERGELAKLYAPGTSLWRVPMRHFSPSDYNFAAAEPPEDAPEPNNEPPPPPCEDQAVGSIINCQSRTLAEEVDVAGTDYTLRYQSDRSGDGSRHKRQINLRFRETPPTGATQLNLKVTVGGRVDLNVNLPPNTREYVYTWSGFDRFGRAWPGIAEVEAVISYVVPPTYVVFSQDIPTLRARGVFNRIGCLNPSAIPADTNYRASIVVGRSPTTGQVERISTRPRRFKVGSYTAAGLGLGGWGLKELHYYSPTTQTLYEGSGRAREIDDVFEPVKLMAGYSSDNVGGNSASGVTAFDGDLHRPLYVISAPDGSAYYRNDTIPGGLWRITPDGMLFNVARSVSPAFASLFTSARHLTADARGRLYMGLDSRLYRVELAADGTLSAKRLTGAAAPFDPDYAAHSSMSTHWLPTGS